MKAILIVLAFLVTIAAPFVITTVQLSRFADTDALVAELAARTPSLLARYDVPGVAMAIVEGGELRWTGTFGYANLEERLGVEARTVFQVASVSKPVTAVGVMRLVESGVLALDDPVGRHLTSWRLPDSEHDAEGVTIARLLSHTAGLTVHGYPGYAPAGELPTLEQSLSGSGLPTPAVTIAHPPGAAYRYSGGGYTLLELMLEDLTGRSFASLMAAEVLGPLGMNDSGFEWRDELRAATATAYDAALRPVPNYLFTERAAAGLYTTVADLSRFVIASHESFHGRSDGFLSRESMATLYAPRVEATGLTRVVYERVGLGHFVNTTPGGDILVGHDGANRGWRSSITLAPETGDAIVLLSNGDNGDYLIRHVLDAWHQAVFAAPRFPALNLTRNGVHALTGALLLWSGLALAGVVNGLRAGRRSFTLSIPAWRVALRLVLLAVLVLVILAVAGLVVPVLGLLGPAMGPALLAALVLRSVIAVLEMTTPRRVRNNPARSPAST